MTLISSRIASRIAIINGLPAMLALGTAFLGAMPYADAATRGIVGTGGTITQTKSAAVRDHRGENSPPPRPCIHCRPDGHQPCMHHCGPDGPEQPIVRDHRKQPTIRDHRN